MPHRQQSGWLRRMGLGQPPGCGDLDGLQRGGMFFVGPDAVVSDMAESMGISAGALETSHPAVASDIPVNQHQVAIFLVAIGAIGLTAALAGLRGSERWVWRSTWVLAAIPVASAANACGFPDRGVRRFHRHDGCCWPWLRSWDSCWPASEPGHCEIGVSRPWVIKRWRAVPRSLVARGLIPSRPSVGGDESEEFLELVDFLDGLVHAKASRPDGSDDRGGSRSSAP